MNENSTAVITPIRNGTAPKRRLDIGAGAKRDEGWETMDLSPVYSPDFQHDLTQLPWPLADESFDELRCWHVLEHIERRYQIPVMNEMHRVLKTGGVADIEVPVFPYWTAMADPTHVSFFVPQSFWYFTKSEYAEHRDLYGIKTWKMRDGWRDGQGSIVRVELEKP